MEGRAGEGEGERAHLLRTAGEMSVRGGHQKCVRPGQNFLLHPFHLPSTTEGANDFLPQRTNAICIWWLNASSNNSIFGRGKKSIDALYAPRNGVGGNGQAGLSFKVRPQKEIDGW